MMFTSRFTILALFAFLVGANAACATCQETLDVDGVTYELVTSLWKMNNGNVVCNYLDKKGDEVTCEYTVRNFWMLSSSSFSFDTLDGHQESGVFRDGNSNCPQSSRKEDFGC
ncbi:hypothetical protein C8R48DRAFT_680803 [Suillus tomentosus]|nr:hypothetical protein C8R48DRAFT_680803 [Suillus tomentosus]